MMRVEAVQCPYCKDVVVSRHQHDLNYCSCGATAVDGGREYLREIYSDRNNQPKHVFILIDGVELMSGSGVFPLKEAVNETETYSAAGGKLLVLELSLPKPASRKSRRL